MPFVRTADDIRRLQAVLRRPTFTGLRTIAGTFRTDAALIRRLLPPPLTPTEPLARAWVCDVQASNIAGAFAGAGLDLAAAHGVTPGWYTLLMPMSTDTAVQVGRETLGEPKKLCDIAFERVGDTVRGHVVRRGVPLITLEVIPTAELGPVTHESVSFHYKYLLACNGEGYDAPPQLVHATHRLETVRASAGAATLTLGSAPHDPLADVPVLEMVSGTYAEGEDTVEAHVACAVDGAAFLPWALANTDDWLAFTEVQKRVRGLSARNAAGARV